MLNQLMKVKNLVMLIWRQILVGLQIVNKKRVGLISFLKVPNKVKIQVNKLILSLQA
jgi:hypothetical protein